VDDFWESLIRYLRQAKGKVIKIDRPGSRRQRLDLRVDDFDEESGRISIKFIGGKSNGLPLYSWMFKRVKERLERSRGFIPIGARLAPPYPVGSLEAAIWEGKRSPYKAAPHVCDILVDAGLVVYGMCPNLDTGRMVQAARLIKGGSQAAMNENGPALISELVQPKKRAVENPWIRQEHPVMSSLDIEEMRAQFFEENGSVIGKWTRKNQLEIKNARERYSWGRKQVERCVRERNEVAQAITNSRSRNGGAVDLDTLDLVIKWGFNSKFPLRDEDQALALSREAFGKLDAGDIGSATLTLMDVKRVGISRASKILGLSDQVNLCIYDSRVGNALRDLKKDGIRLVRCPPGRVQGRDYDLLSDDEWTEDYRRTIWIVQAIRDQLRKEGLHYNCADVEMALFMMGE
jgi:hypothetical protein